MDLTVGISNGGANAFNWSVYVIRPCIFVFLTVEKSWGLASTGLKTMQRCGSAAYSCGEHVPYPARITGFS